MYLFVFLINFANYDEANCTEALHCIALQVYLLIMQIPKLKTTQNHHLPM